MKIVTISTKKLKCPQITSLQLTITLAGLLMKSDTYFELLNFSDPKSSLNKQECVRLWGQKLHYTTGYLENQKH